MTRRFVLRAIGLAAGSALFASPAVAQLKGNPENWCRNGHFPRESKDYRLAKIKGAKDEKVHFHDDGSDKCPADETCRTKAYVVPGDDIIVSRTFGQFACSWFQPRKGHETVGWIATDRLAWVEGKQPPAERAWLGTWRAYSNFIRISRAKAAGELKVSGEASWGSGANTRIGGLDHTAKPSAGRMSFGDGTDEYDCQVTMQLVGKYLIVADNLHCGGANVTFSGVYVRR